MYKYFEGVRPHHGVMFENRVQPDHCYASRIKFLVYSLRLRNTYLYATRTEDLESMQYNHFPPQRGERNWFGCIEPS